MADPYEIIASRATEGLPLSVGTGLAIDAIKDLKGYDTLWINVRTLWRNLYEAIETDKRESFFDNNRPRDKAVAAMANTLREEILFIKTHLAETLSGVRFYYLGYQDLPKKYPHAILKQPSTDLQKRYVNLMERSLDTLLQADVNQTIELDKGSEIRGEPTRSLIITHYPTDLLSKFKFTKLRLLESHTGAVKSSSEWYTKLTDGKELKTIPFNYFTIQIFGDGGGAHFGRYPIKIRRALLEVAQKYKWTPVTSMDRIKLTLSRMSDQYAAAQLKKVL